MKTLVVYESIFGNTHAIATAIGRGLAEGGASVTVLPVGSAEGEVLSDLDLLVVGGPTHAWSMTRTMTRTNAVREAQQAGQETGLDPAAEGPGLRDWFETLPQQTGVAAAAFDTRVDVRISGGAAPGIAKRLKKHGCRLVAVPAGFFVTDKDGPLQDGEESRAETWGATLATLALSSGGD